MLFIVLIILGVFLLFFNTRPNSSLERPAIWPWSSKAAKEKYARITKEIEENYDGDYEAYKNRHRSAV